MATVLEFPEISDYRQDSLVLDESNTALAHVLTQLHTWQHAIPILIWGTAGTGKSCLLHNLASCQQNTDVEVVLAADLKGAPARQSGDESENILLIDDIHRLCGDRAAQARLIELLDGAQNAAATVVLTSRVHPLLMTNTREKLRSRLVGGLSVELRLPGPAARAVLIQRIAQRAGWNLTPDAAAYGAQQLGGSVFQLKDRMGRCLPQRPDNEKVVHLEDFRLMLEAQRPSYPQARVLMKLVARAWGVEIKQLVGASRRRNVVLARSVAMYLIREGTGLALKTIGELFGKRDHTTVMHACQKISTQLQHDVELKAKITELTSWTGYGESVSV